MKNRILFIAVSLVAVSQARSSTIQCWGNNSAMQSSVPEGLVSRSPDPAAKTVAMGYNFSCELDSKSVVNCWGLDDATVRQINAVPQITNIVTGYGNSSICANGMKGLQCFPQTSESVPKVGSKAEVVMGYRFTCSLENATVNCAGSYLPKGDLTQFKNPSKIVGSDYEICVLDDNGVQCFENAYGDVGIPTVPKLDHPSDVFLSRGYACAVDKAGLQCWGDPGYDDDALAPDPLPTHVAGTQYAGNINGFCTLLAGAVKCYGQNDVPAVYVPTLKNPTALYSNAISQTICAHDDTGFVCWGQDGNNQASRKAFDSVSAGYGNTCVSASGKASCWGTGSQNIATVPADYTNVTHVVVGSNFACGVSADSFDKYCWGDNTLIINNSSMLRNGADALTAGFAHVCFSTGGSVACFGANDFGQSTPPVGMQVDTSSRSLVSGGHHSCGIDSMKGLLCWGENKFGQTNVPKDLKNVAMIAAGFQHTCAIDDSGLRCWGRNTEGQTNVPTLSHPTVVRAGGYHTCAIDDSGAHCWGDDSFGQADIPKEITTQISDLTTGYIHTCAVVK